MSELLFKKKPLREAFKFINGKSMKPIENGIYPLYGSNGLIGYSKEYRFENCLVIGRVGAYCGSVVYCKGRFWATDNTIVAQPINSDFDIKFLYYLLVDAKLNRYAGGAAQPLLTQIVLHQVELAFPPLPIQRKIASILSAYDDLIENNTHRIHILEEMAGAIYREWFVHFRFPGHENVKMVESEIGLIPEGWQNQTLGMICELIIGQSPKSEFYNEHGEGLPFHQGVKDFGDLFPTHITYCTDEKRIAEESDILFSVRAPVGRINIANARIIIGRGLHAIRHKKGYQNFLYHQLKTIFFEEDIIGCGTIYKSVTKSDMLNLDFLIPPDDIVMQFESKVNPIFGLTKNLILKNENLLKTRDLLLPRLISGELDVSELDIHLNEEVEL